MCNNSPILIPVDLAEFNPSEKKNIGFSSWRADHGLLSIHVAINTGKPWAATSAVLRLYRFVPFKLQFG